jgi:dephospho-CoA kinase
VNNQRVLVGLTGGIASGKTTVSDAMAALGAQIVDTDAIARALTAPGGAAMPAIMAAFGPDIAQADGAMNRTKMRDIAFSAPSARKQLETILHPLIHSQSQSQIAHAQANYQGDFSFPVVVVPLMSPNSQWTTQCARVVVVDCTPAQQLQRLIQRSQLDPEQAKAIMAAQIGREERLSMATDVIDNHADGANLAADTARLMHRLVHYFQQNR